MQKYYFNTIIKLSLCASVLLNFTSCVKDISKEELVLILPTDGHTYTTNNVHFKWREVEKAEGYRLEIVKPSFANIQEFVLDSVIEGTEFYEILSPGEYQFQIRAENSAYETNYVGPYTIKLDSVTDLSNQSILLTAPLNMYATNTEIVNCSWQSVYAADYYQFQLRSGLDFEGSVIVPHNQTDIYSINYTIPSEFLIEGEYSWGIKAHNQNSSSAYSSRSFIIDKTLPNDVSLISPLADAIETNTTVVFKWDSGIDPGTVNTPVSAKIEISNNNSFSSIYHSAENIVSDSLELEFDGTGDYWWRVMLLDEAGNQSENYLEERKVTIQ